MACSELYGALKAAGIDVLYDDRDQGAGAKFATADLIGVPYQLVLGPRGLKNGEAEIKNRRDGVRENMPLSDAVRYLVDAIVPQRMDTF